VPIGAKLLEGSTVNVLAMQIHRVALAVDQNTLIEQSATVCMCTCVCVHL